MSNPWSAMKSQISACQVFVTPLWCGDLGVNWSYLWLFLFNVFRFPSGSPTCPSKKIICLYVHLPSCHQTWYWEINYKNMVFNGKIIYMLDFPLPCFTTGGYPKHMFTWPVALRRTCLPCIEHMGDHYTSLMSSRWSHIVDYRIP